MGLGTRIICVLTALLIVGAASHAQNTIAVSGSSIANGLVEHLAEAHGAALDAGSVGSARGFAAFCAGETDLATATREMTDAESENCAANNVSHNQLLLGHQVVALAAHPDAPDACFSDSQLDDLFKPTASHRIKDWSIHSEDDAELPLTVVLPGNDHSAYAILDGKIVGDGLRLDVEQLEGAEAIDFVAQTPGALAVMLLSETEGAGEAIKLLDLRHNMRGECVAPSVEAVENDEYAAAQSLYVYVNRGRLDANESLMGLLEFAIDPANAILVWDAGIAPPSETVYELNARLLSDAEAGALPVDEADEYVIPESLEGSVRIAGAALAYQALNYIGEDLTRSHDSVSVEFDMAGTDAGLASLCAGDADIAVMDAADADTACENGAATLTFPIGAQAVALVGNAADDFAACLTSGQIATIWRAESAESVMQWSDVDADFPETDMTLFGLMSLDAHTDILLQAAGDVIPPVRRDTEQDWDAKYRAAAVANVPGALTYMSWEDYQGVLDNEQARIQLVAVDGGAGCLAPSASAIGSGEYPLSRGASLLARQESLAEASAQSYLWTVYSDSNWTFFEREGFIGTSALELPVIRRDLQVAFQAAEAAYPPTDESADTDEADDAEAESG